MKKLFIFVIIVFAVSALGGFLYYRSTMSQDSELVTVIRGDVSEIVSVAGKIKSASVVDLAFERGGKISSVNTVVGAYVGVGQMLLAQDASVLFAQLQGAEADYDAARARLLELKNGTRPEEITLAEIKVQNAKVVFEDSRRSFQNSLRDAYSTSDNAVRIQGDQLFSNSRSASPVLNVYADSSLKTKLEIERVLLEPILVKWKSILDMLTEESDVSLALSETKSNMTRIRAYIDHLALVINALTQTSSLSQVSIDGYRTSIIAARGSLNVSISAIASAEEKIRSAVATINIAEQELLLKKAGPRKEALAAEEARTRQFEARVLEIRAELDKTKLRAPISGVVTKQDAKLWAIVAPNIFLVSVISDGKLEIEASVPEIDTGRIRIGNPVEIVLDAFSGEVFKGTIIHVDPAETLIDGVVNFKITASIDGAADPRMKSGLTANLVIETHKKAGVLTLPQYALLENENGFFVRVPEGEGIKEIPVVIGIRGHDGRVEIVSGLKEGDRVVNEGSVAE